MNPLRDAQVSEVGVTLSFATAIPSRWRSLMIERLNSATPPRMLSISLDIVDPTEVTVAYSFHHKSIGTTDYMLNHPPFHETLCRGLGYW
jgi:hypothetical protein